MVKISDNFFVGKLSLLTLIAQVACQEMEISDDFFARVVQVACEMLDIRAKLNVRDLGSGEIILNRCIAGDTTQTLLADGGDAGRSWKTSWCECGRGGKILGSNTGSRRESIVPSAGFCKLLDDSVDLVRLALKTHAQEN
jgi:hypothetical protein